MSRRDPQERVQRHTVEQMIESFVLVPMLDLDASVPQMAEQMVGVLSCRPSTRPRLHSR